MKTYADELIQEGARWSKGFLGAGIEWSTIKRPPASTRRRSTCSGRCARQNREVRKR